MSAGKFSGLSNTLFNNKYFFSIEIPIAIAMKKRMVEVSLALSWLAAKATQITTEKDIKIKKASTPN
jgi:hypothetical protein